MNSKTDNMRLPEDLRVFLTVISKAGFAAAAEGLRLSPGTGWRLANVPPPIIPVSSASAETPALRWLLEQWVEEQTAHLPGYDLATSQIARLRSLQVLREENINSQPWPLRRPMCNRAQCAKTHDRCG